MSIIKRGDIRICDLGDNEGSIQAGVRPALIVSNNKGNKYSPVVIVVPLTSKTESKKVLPTHVVLTQSMGVKEKSLLMTEQILTINKKQVGRRVGKLSRRMMQVVDKKMNISLGVQNRNSHNGNHRHKRIQSGYKTN